ncbi:MAG: Uncharacterized protein E1N59_2811 [Puniceicoccaceae bacterium 5H]|nr:MAG: Uncharacterized protein E1N59_2811 [Puniceicoccaceae bacterium 5H]
MPARAALYTAYHAEDIWAVVEAWCRTNRLSFAPPEKPDVVVAPSRAAAAALKVRLLDAGIGFVGLQFWTPSDLRRHLVAHDFGEKTLATREDLQLLAALARPELPDDAAHGVAPAPDAWLSAWDELATAGWGSDAFAVDFAAQWANQYAALLRQTDLLTAPLAEWQFAEAAPEERPLGQVLLVGFTAAHLRWQTLLRGVLRQADEVILALPTPAPTDLGQVWWGTWESLAGEAQVVSQPELPPQPLEPLTQALETGSVLGGPVPLELNLARTLTEEAELVTRQVLHCLEDPECARVGVLLPGSHGLARLVAQRLQDLEVPHHDTFGFFAAPNIEQRLFNRWVAWQETRRLDEAEAFFSLLVEHRLIDATTFARLRRQWENAAGALISDDYALAREWLRVTEADPHGLEHLDAWPLLEDRATWSSYVQQAGMSLEQLGWREPFDALVEKRPGLAQLTATCDRETFLRWLAESLRTPGRQRQTWGRDAFARVQLLDYREAGGQVFSHAILAGLADGQWPPQEPETAFLTDHDRRRLNQEIVAMGTAGEGQLALLGERGFLPTFSDRRILARESLLEVLRQTTVQAYASCTAHRDREVGEPLQPGEWFWELVYAQDGRLWKDAELARQQAITARRWLEASLETASPPDNELTPVAATGEAARARLDPQQPFGAWDGGFAQPPETPLILSAGTWERVLSAPAEVWMQHITGLQPGSRLQDAAADYRVRGIWVHRWLESVVRAAAESGLPDDYATPLRAFAQRERLQAEQTWQRLQRARPVIWPSVWQESLRIAEHCGRLLASIDSGWQAVPEYALPKRAQAVLGGVQLPISGRVDLLLQRGGASGKEYWIIDYKTGKRKALRPKDALKGESLQLMLYALALPAAGAPTRISLLSEQVEDIGQIQSTDLEDLQPLLEDLAQAQQRGVFGFTGPTRSQYRYEGTYPFAILPLPTWVLQAKWSRTHPHLPFPA